LLNGASKVTKPDIVRAVSNYREETEPWGRRP
jgi:hypothetical protein